MTDEHGTALKTAHARFVRSLVERGRELRALCESLEPAPDDERLAERLRHRLHALQASAQLFQEDLLLDALSPVVDALDAARDGYRPLHESELTAVRALCDALDPDIGAQLVPPPPAGEGLDPLWFDAGIEGTPDDPLLLARTLSGGLIAPDVIAALLVGGPEVEREVRAALPAEYCEITSTAEPETALLVIDHVAPDLVLIEAGMLRDSPEQIARGLRDDRRALCAIVPELASDAEVQLARTWADATLHLPLPRVGLLERLQRLAGRGARAQSPLERLHAGTVDEIARSVGQEVQRGIAAMLRTGRDERIELVDKTDLLAATWSAVARIRQSLAERARGRVRFDPSAYRGGPLPLALTDDSPAAPYVGLSESLAGRRIVIVDDDPSVVWFFAGLVREAGGVAVEALDGREALERMRLRPPDLLVSDIVMPGIDGFSLCRELKRDVELCHVPVVLLSWKEDFLQRMRELDAGASGYLRKEAGTHQILSTLGEALRPRAELEALLASDGEVHGRIDPIGVVTLLRSVAARRPNARVRIRDAWNLFEIDLRVAKDAAADDAQIGLTRTAADGSFARGHDALLQLLGVDIGRYSVSSADAPLRGSLGQPLGRALEQGLAKLGGLFDALSDTRLMQINRVELDDEVLRPLLAATPTALADLVSRLRAGESPRALVVDGVIGAGDLEQQLRELARRGAILRVWGGDGVDLAADAARARAEHPGELLHGGDGTRGSPLPTLLNDGDVEWVEPEPHGALPWPMDGESARPPPVPMSVPDAALAEADEALGELDEALAEAVETLPDSDAAPDEADETPAEAAEPAASDEALVEAVETLADSDQAPAESDEALAERVEDGESRPPPPLHPRSSSPPAPGAHPAPPPVPRARPHAQKLAPAAATRRLPLPLTLAVVAALGFAGYRALEPDATPRAAQQPAPASTSGPAASSSARSSAKPAASRADEPQDEQALENAEAPTSVADDPGYDDESTPGYGRVLPFIDHRRGVNVGKDQGLLVVEYEGGTPAPSVRVGTRELGRAPAAVALPSGRHELVLRRAGQTSFRYVVIRAGETRIVDARQ